MVSVTLWVHPSVFASSALFCLIVPLVLGAGELFHLWRLTLSAVTLTWALAVPCVLIAWFLLGRLLAWDQALWLLEALTRKLQAVEGESSNLANA
jgi:hypothetical protein